MYVNRVQSASIVSRYVQKGVESPEYRPEASPWDYVRNGFR